ncbi:MAG: efflux RND transporter permease subunit [Myxococcales bacterium]|nr:efflux RND transporter permease subunit [Myxococcales bacterium]USN50156.1 MAG: efflux RND transporter permease subunit [Myxococcales bacterium]
MKWTNFFIERPVTAVVVNIMLVISGLLAFKGLLIDEYPRIIVPKLSVETSYSNASTETIEKEITTPIEEKLSLVEGLEKISSESRAGHSKIHLWFSPKISMDRAFIQVNEQVSRISGKLPKEADPPRINRSGGGEPFLYLTVKSSALMGAELTHFTSTHIKNSFQGIDGLAEVKVWGPPYIMSVVLDPLAMHNQNIEPAQIVEVLKKNELLLQAGQTKSGQPIDLDVVARNPSDYEQMIIGNNSGAPVYLGDIAQIRLMDDDQEGIFRVDGQRAILIALVKASDANVLEVTKAVKKIIPKVNRDLRGKAHVYIESDKSIFVSESLKTIYKTIIEACILVLLIIFLFLRHVRATLIPLVTIPISLCATFLALKIFGLSINIISLLAMVLAVGLVVDDAIVVLENIFRYREQGLSALEAAKKGTQEIGFAIIAMTLTLMSVFLPLIFVSDITGALLREFAITLAAAVFFSGIVALSLSPLMCAKLLQKPAHENSIGRTILAGIIWLEKTYALLLHRFFNHQKIVYACLAVVIVCGAFVYQKLDSNLIPKEDRGIIGASIPDIPGFDSDDMDTYVDQVEQLFLSRSEVLKTLTSINEGYSHVIAILKPWKERKKHAETIVEEIRDEVKQLPLAVYPWSDNIGLDALQDDSNSDSSIVVAIKSPKSYVEIERIASALSERFGNDGILKDAHSDLNMNQLSIAVVLKREALTQLNISEKNISMALQTMSDRMRASSFNLEGQSYSVYLSSSSQVKDLELVYLSTKNGTQVPLSTVANIDYRVQAPTLRHLNQMRTAQVLANLSDSTSLSDARNYLDKTIPDIVPADMSVSYEGALGMQERSSKTFALLFLAGLIFIFAIMAIQFEDIIDPLIILLTVPFACIGGAFLLWVMGEGTNLYTQLGMLTLIGLITKHGILLTEFVSSKRKIGVDLKSAVFEAARLRFRPIIMTTAAMVLGALPLIISSGAGSEARRAIGIVIVGGLTFGTLLVLFVLPISIYSVYSLRTRLGN